MCNLFTPAKPTSLERYVEIPPGEDPDAQIKDVGPFTMSAFITPRGLEHGQWGMIPRTSKTRRPITADGKPMSTNNARHETMTKSWTFGPSWRDGKRCIVPVDRWIEPFWGTGKNIWWAIWRADGAVAGIAGLYSYWTDPDTGEVVPNFTMITQPAEDHPLLSQMHRPGKEKRSLVLLEQASWDTWLNGTQAQAAALIHLPAAGLLNSGAKNPAEEALLAPELLQFMKSLH